MVYLKLIILIFVMLIFFISTMLISCFYSLFPNMFRRGLAFLVSFFSKMILNVLNVEVEKYGEFDIDKNYLIISNHMTYLDIMIMSSVVPSSFITSIEMKNTFFLGQIVTLGRCLFTERRGYKNLLNEIDEVEKVLKNGFSVVLFPEAKSTNGDRIIPFKRAFFRAAKQAHTSILPVVINYLSIDDEIITTQNRDEVFWYDGMGFVSHFLNLCKKKKIKVELYFEESFSPEEPSRKLRDKAFEKIQSKYDLVKKL